MDARQVAVAVGVGAAAVAVVLALVAGGALAPLYTTEGYQPSNETASPTAVPAGTDDGVADDGTTDDGTGTDSESSGGGSAGSPTASPTPSRYDHATVAVVDESGTTLGRVRAAVADTAQKRYTGLSKTDHLPEDRGMLFVYDREGQHTYVMREMDFGIDIVYVGADRRITRIHHAPEPPDDADGEEYEYPGRGQYVLEVNYNWTVRHNVSVGDRVRIDGLE